MVEASRIHENNRTGGAGARGDIVVDDWATKLAFQLGMSKDRITKVAIDRPVVDLALETLERAA